MMIFLKGISDDRLTKLSSELRNQLTLFWTKGTKGTSTAMASFSDLHFLWWNIHNSKKVQILFHIQYLSLAYISDSDDIDNLKFFSMRLINLSNNSVESLSMRQYMN